MKTDRYTKIILTVIAVCLVSLCVRSYLDGMSVHAQAATTSPQEVTIVGISDSTKIPVRIIGMADDVLVPVRVDGSGRDVVLPVGIAGGRGTIPVSIQGINPAVTVPIGIRGVRYNNISNQWDWAPIPVRQNP